MVVIAMTDEDVVRKSAIAMNCRTRIKKVKPNRKQAWIAHVHGDKAVNVMKRILPFMGARRKAKIEEVLSRAAHRATPHEIGILGNRAKRYGKKLNSMPLPFGVHAA